MTHVQRHHIFADIDLLLLSPTKNTELGERWVRQHVLNCELHIYLDHPNQIKYTCL